MTTNRDEEWRDFASKLERRITARVVQLCGDEALADEITRDVLAVARASFHDVHVPRPSWRWLDELAIRLTAERTRPEVVPPALAAVAAQSGAPANPEVVSRALGRVDEDERVALALHYVNGFDADEGARFFDTEPERFADLLDRARRRLQEEYRRLVEGLMAGLLVTLEATRRLRRTWARSRAALADNLAARWVRLDPLHAVDALTASTAANFSFAAAVVVGAGVLSSGAAVPSAHAMPPASPVVSGRVMVSWASEVAASASEVATWTTRAATAVANVAPSRPVSVTTQQTAAGAAADEPTRGTVAGPVTKTEYPEKGVTRYQVEPPPPAEPAPSVPAPLPTDTPSPPTAPDTGLEDGPPTLKAGYTCPPPDQRPPPLAVACPLLEPVA